MELVAAVGKPAPEILRVAVERGCDLIIMSSRGLSGVRKLFFGSTTERVLRETSVPVLVTPPRTMGPSGPAEIGGGIERALVPVDLSSLHAQMEASREIAAAFGASLLLMHVVEPTRGAPGRLQLPRLDLERRTRAEQQLDELIASLPAGARAEALVTYGDPAEEIANVARDRRIGLVVMGLHSSPMLGPRMGSVTYRVLCLVQSLVLAVPPAEAASPRTSRIADAVRQSR
jgi:nucleotide-binding universal stress UspA family protein